ncbi:MAG: hypothetical protein HY055_09210 [Magnetospirillum sp.]|nr:hypothetical protein [Magnetospirillum sp.]
MDPLEKLKLEVAKAVAAVCNGKDDSVHFAEIEVANKISGTFGRPVVSVVLAELRDEGCISAFTINGRTVYGLKPEFIKKYGLHLLANDSTQAAVPASDRIVTLNHNQSDYQQAVEALDRVLEEFRNDHRLDNELGPQKEAHLKVLEGGRKALEDKEISVEDGQDWIIKSLKWIGEKFADGAVKVAALKAIELLSKLLGLGS